MTLQHADLDNAIRFSFDDRPVLSEVDGDFARDEGEGDLSPVSWRSAHETFFARNGGFAPDMDVVCERFRLVQVLVPGGSDQP